LQPSYSFPQRSAKFVLGVSFGFFFYCGRFLSLFVFSSPPPLSRPILFSPLFSLNAHGSSHIPIQSVRPSALERPPDRAGKSLQPDALTPPLSLFVTDTRRPPFCPSSKKPVPPYIFDILCNFCAFDLYLHLISARLCILRRLLSLWFPYQFSPLSDLSLLLSFAGKRSTGFIRLALP